MKYRKLIIYPSFSTIYLSLGEDSSEIKGLRSTALDICLSTKLLDNLVSNAIYQPDFC